MATFNGYTIIPLPSSPPAPRSIEWSAANIVGATASPFTGQQQIQNWGAGWPEISLSYASMGQSLGPAWTAFLMALQGAANIFQFGDPRITKPQGTGAGTPLVNGANQTGYTLATRGWTNNAVGVLLPGDPIQIGFRLYWNLTPANADSSGHSTLSIWPNIRESPLDGAVITLNNTQGVWRLNNNKPRWTQSPGGIYAVTFEAREAI
jgi:hypothetical protein